MYRQINNILRREELAYRTIVTLCITAGFLLLAALFWRHAL